MNHTLSQIQLKAPYLVFIGDTADRGYAKTGLGIVQWSADKVAGQLRLNNNPLDLGVPDMSVEQAVAAGVKSLLIGVAPVGGTISDSWIDTLSSAAAAGLDIISGLHMKLEDLPAIANAAKASGAQLINVRTPPATLPIGNGKKRSGNRLLMVGTDCAVGKKYSALALTRVLKAQGVDARFCATGQTGIMIAGQGVPIDAVVADFISGAAEAVSPAADKNHWDVIEGQGSLYHPAYAGVSLGLLHGSQPDAIVLCHNPSREHLLGFPDYPIPDVNACIQRNIDIGSLTNSAIRCVGICVNTSALPPSERKAYLSELADYTGLPCADPLIDDLNPIVQRLMVSCLKH